MKALFLTGELETLLKPLTDGIPKSMIPIMNKPLLERSITNLRRWNIDEIVISTNAKSKSIKQYFGNGKRFGLTIEYVFEEPSMGIGGILKKAASFFKDTFLVLNADIVCNIDIDDLIKTHKSKSAGVTIAVAHVDNASGCDVIESDGNGYAVLSAGKPVADKIKSDSINAGVYVFEPEVINEISQSMPTSLVREIFPALALKGVKFAVYKGCTYWMDMATPEQYLQVHKDILTGTFNMSGVHFIDQGIFKDGKSVISPNAIITGPVYIGDNVKIGAYATIGPNTVIGDDVTVHLGGSVVGSVLWNNVDIGICAKMDGSVAASDCKIKRKAVHSNTAFTKTKSVKWKRIAEKTIIPLEA